MQIPQQCRLEMTPNDIAEGERLLKEDFVQKNPVCACNSARVYVLVSHSCCTGKNKEQQDPASHAAWMGYQILPRMRFG